MKKYKTESISRYINQLYREGVSFLGKEYKEYNIGAGQYQFLVYLYTKDGITHDELTEIIGVDKAATTRAISKLEKLGYVTKIQDTYDKRKYYIFLTEYAKEHRDNIINISMKWEYKLISELTDNELKELYNIFRKMTKYSSTKIFEDENI